MKTRRVSHIVMALCAVFAAAVLFVTYGTVLPAAPLASVQLNGPIAADSDGEFTAVVDAESNRAIIMNADGDMTGVVRCDTFDAPINAITDVCVMNGLVYLSGVRFMPDSDLVALERVVVYDKGGNLQSVIYEMEGNGTVAPSIKSLSNGVDGIVIAYEALANLVAKKDGDASSENKDEANDAEVSNKVVFAFANRDESYELYSATTGSVSLQDVAVVGKDGGYYTTLSMRGILNDGASDYANQVYAGHVFTDIDVDADGNLYVCDDETGALCVITAGSSEVRELVSGDGYRSVHENNGVISLCDTGSGKVLLCDKSGEVKSEFNEVRPSVGFSARMILVWASGLYLAVLVLVLAARKVRRVIKEGKTDGVGPMLTAIAVVFAVAIAITNLSFASYQKSLELRANEINMCADYLEMAAYNLGDSMEGVGGRDALRGNGDELGEAATKVFQSILPALGLVQAANSNEIGMYCNLYGKDDRGVYYLIGSADEFVLGSSVRSSDNKMLYDAFEKDFAQKYDLLTGHTLRDATLYRLVQIPTSDGQGVAGVIEIGSKMRSFESSITGDLARRILTLLVMVLVVYLTYSELRSCGRCLFSYRQHQRESPTEAVALLTRPFTLAITILASIDSVMTVLIARDLLSNTEMGASSPLLALPAVMLGVGMVIGQGLYAIAGSRVGLRKLMVGGAGVMLLCAGFAGAAVAFGGFWWYCAAKLVMAVPFGLLYTLGYSFPRAAASDEVRTAAAGGVRRTDTSAAALGTVLGGYAAQVLGNAWVYVLVAAACLPIVLMALSLLPRGARPLEAFARSGHRDGRMRNFVMSRPAIAIALLIVLPATVAAGYASFLFPLFSSDLGLTKSDINNVIVLGQIVVYVCISRIESAESRFGIWRVAVVAVALLGVVFLLFSVNTTLVWSFAVVALVGLLCKSADAWKVLWLAAADKACVPAGGATGAMFALRSLALVVQPFILAALLGATSSLAVIVIGMLCLVCAGLFFLTTRSSLYELGLPGGVPAVEHVVQDVEHDYGDDAHADGDRPHGVDEGADAEQLRE